MLQATELAEIPGMETTLDREKTHALYHCSLPLNVAEGPEVERELELERADFRQLLGKFRLLRSPFKPRAVLLEHLRVDRVAGKLYRHRDRFGIEEVLGLHVRPAIGFALLVHLVVERVRMSLFEGLLHQLRHLAHFRKRVDAQVSELVGRLPQVGVPGKVGGRAGWQHGAQDIECACRDRLLVVLFLLAFAAGVSHLQLFLELRQRLDVERA